MKRKEPDIEVKPTGTPDYEVNTCCLCGGTFTEWPNNPAPLAGEWIPDQVGCCDPCNWDKVLPARFIARGLDPAVLNTIPAPERDGTGKLMADLIQPSTNPSKWNA